MQSSPASRHFLPLRSKYSPQHPVLILNICSSFMWDTKLNAHTKAGKIIEVCIEEVHFLSSLEFLSPPPVMRSSKCVHVSWRLEKCCSCCTCFRYPVYVRWEILMYSRLKPTFWKEV
jgi:hypothetical protein